MRGNVVLLHTLGVGRCFTLPVEPAPPPAERPREETPSAGPGLLRHAQPVLAPGQAWRVTGEDPQGGLLCESAAGARRAFPGAERVVEIPRQGWDKLAAALPGRG